MQRPVILLSGLPPDLPDGFIRRPYRPSDRPDLPTALPEALAGRVTWVILTGWFYTPDLPAGFVPAARPASLTSSPTGSLTSQPHQPALPTALPAASPARLTGRFRQPDFPTARPNASSTSRPACLTDSPTGSHTGHPHPPATPPTHTSQPHKPARPARPAASPAILDQPSSPAKVPPASLTGRLRSAGRRLRGWR